ncbi:hypothetical protein QQP08_002349 [Theobroma cacao]|nr:hypothetical protein QQP08_002349 [Theobroma cacao]
MHAAVVAYEASSRNKNKGRSRHQQRAMHSASSLSVTGFITWNERGVIAICCYLNLLPKRLRQWFKAVQVNLVFEFFFFSLVGSLLARVLVLASSLMGLYKGRIVHYEENLREVLKTDN